MQTTPTNSLPSWLLAAKSFQDNTVLNRATLLVLGHDVPRLVLARNKDEQAEQLFKQGLTLLLASVLAPLHARFFFKLFSGKLNNKLLFVSFKHLNRPEDMAKGLKLLNEELQVSTNGKYNLLNHLNPDIRQTVRDLLNGKAITGALRNKTESLRIRLLKAKSKVIGCDLATEMLLMGCVGPLKNTFTQWRTGKKQFTGEVGATDQKTLDKIYAKRKAQNTASWRENLRKWLNPAFAVVIPSVIYSSINKAFLKNQASGLSKFIATKAHLLDHRPGYSLARLPLYAASFSYLVGDIASARSKNEVKEDLIRHVFFNISYILGDMALVSVMTKLAKSDKLHLAKTIGETIKKAPEAKKIKAGRYATLLYLSSFLLNTVILSSIIVACNRMTIKNVQQEAEKIKKLETSSVTNSKTSNFTSPKNPSLNVNKTVAYHQNRPQFLYLSTEQSRNLDPFSAFNHTAVLKLEKKY